MRSIHLLVVFVFLLGSCQTVGPSETVTRTSNVALGTSVDVTPNSLIGTQVTTSGSTLLTMSTKNVDQPVDGNVNTLTPRIPANETGQAIHAIQSQVAPTVQLRLTATAAAASTKISNLSMLCMETEPFCVLDGHFLFQRPIGSDGNNSVDYTYRYGSTQSGKRETHHGVEFPNKQGTPVLAGADGVVVFAGNDKKEVLAWVPAYYGNVIVIRHNLPGVSATIYSLYAHLYQISVKVGQQVLAGESIGQVGATGTAIGSHLHFEIRFGTNDYFSNRNPELWLNPLPGTGVLAGWFHDRKGNSNITRVNVQRIKEGRLDPNPVTSLESYFLKDRQPVKSDDVWGENFLAGELPSGSYRLTLHYDGILYEQVVRIEAGKLTFVRFVQK